MKKEINRLKVVLAEKKRTNRWLRYKTKNFTKIPLFTMVFDYQKFRENGKGKSCGFRLTFPRWESLSFCSKL